MKESCIKPKETTSAPGKKHSSPSICQTHYIYQRQYQPNAYYKWRMHTAIYILRDAIWIMDNGVCGNTGADRAPKQRPWTVLT